MPDDFSDSISTTGRVAVGGSVTGEIESAGDSDAYAVELEAGITYRIDMEGAATGRGTLADPFLRWLRDGMGTGIRGTRDHDSGEGTNARQVFTPVESGTYYISARGNGNAAGTYTLTVTDLSPAFGAQSYAFGLLENTDGSTTRISLGTVSATDPEGDTLTYSITGGNQSGLFEIDAASGELFYTGSGEDYESGTTSFSLTVRASDGSLHADTTVTVNITDVEETAQAPPSFGQQGYTFGLAENADGSTNRVSLGTVSATDPESATVTYSIVGGNESGSFEIDASSGELFYTGSGEDFESGTTSYALTVRASDGDLFTDTTVTVSVTDVQEDPTEEPAIEQVQQSVSEPSGEDFSANTSTAGRVAVDGAATGKIGASGDHDWFAVELVAGRTYAIGLKGSPTDDGTLSDTYLHGIHDADGDLISGTTNDDGGEGYNSRVSFTADQSGTYYIAAGAYGSNQGTYTVEVTDISDIPLPVVSIIGQPVPPDFGRQSYAFDLLENTDGSTDRVSLGSVLATDPGGATVSYSIEGGNASGLFEIDSVSGELFYTGSGEDFEAVTVPFELTVRASDGDLFTDTAVTVSVTDVQEVPAFGQQGYAFDLAENSDGSTTRVSLGTVAAVDPDGTALSYSIEGGNTSGLFEIDTASGELFYTGTGEDFESDTTRFTLTVRASDGSETADTTVTVNVTDVEETVDPPVADGDQTAPQTVSEPEDEDFSDDTSTSGRVVVGETATGDIETWGDRDWFAVALVAGREYQIGLRGSPTDDGTLSDPYLRGIYDADGNWISNTTDDDGGQGYNSRLTFTATESGTHYIAAGAYSSNRGTYEVEVTDTSPPIVGPDPDSEDPPERVAVGGSATGEIESADDHDLFAVELEAGKTYQIDMSGEFTGGGTLYHPHLRAVYDADGNNMGVSDPVIIIPTYYNGELIFAGEDEQAFFTPDEDGTYYLAVSNFFSGTTGTYTVQVTEIEDDFPETVDTTGTVEVGGTATGELQYETDRDWFAVELTAGETYKVELLGGRGKGGTLQDPYIRGIHDANGRLISYADTTDYASGPHSNSEVLFTPREDGTYYVAAGSYMSGEREEDVGTYTLQVSIDDFRDDTDTTGMVEVGSSVTGEIEAQGDEDWFAVTLEAGKTYQIDMEGSETDGGTLENPFLHTMRDANGDMLRIVHDNGFWSQNMWTSDQDSGEGLNSRVTFTPDEDGTYYVVAASGGHILAADSHGRSLGFYTLSVEELVDAI